MFSMAITILPPGVDEATFHAFFDEVTKLIGKETVSRDPSLGNLPGPNGEESYVDPWPLARDHTPSGAVRPATVEEVQHVLKAANEYCVPFWTVSRGKDLGYVILLF